MKNKIGLLIIFVCSCFLVGCGNRVDETTIYYSMVTSPSEYYIRLEKDGDFYNNAGLEGTYTLNDDKVTFTDTVGGKTTGYLVDDNYLFFMSYDGNDKKIPAEDKFDVAVYDGTRTTITFNSDGTMEKHIYQENIYDYKITGTYERSDKFIKCTYITRYGETTTQTYGVYDGVLYEVLSSDKNDFTPVQAASIDSLDFIEDEEVSLLAVVMIVVALIVIFALIFYFIFALQKLNKKNKTVNGSNRKQK
ncbi:MAG: hypothetical protein ACI39R_01490 [Lachnospiraceae bacterium]